MERLLTQEEIEALLAAVATGEVRPAEELGQGGSAAVSFDLFSSSKAKIAPSLDLFYDGFIRHFRVTMTNRLRKLVEVTKGTPRSFKFDDFVEKLPHMPHINIFKVEELNKGASLFALDSDMVYLIVDSVLGGDGTQPAMEKNRAFSGIELRIISRIVKDVIHDMEKAWAPILATKVTHIRTELNPRLVNIVPPDYLVLAMSLTIETETGAKGSLIFAVPHASIEPIREKLKTGSQFDASSIDPLWSTRLVQGVQETEVELVAEFGKASLTARELLALEPGDTIILDADIESEMLVQLEGVTKFTAVPGARLGNKAMKILRVLDSQHGEHP